MAAKSGEVFAAAYARWRQDHPEPVLSGDDLARARTGLTERTMAAFDEVFGGAIEKPEDLAERAPLWDQRVERLTSELPAHLAFEATVPAALRTAGRSCSGNLPSRSRIKMLPVRQLLVISAAPVSPAAVPLT
ncbi:hypothetical protein NE236_24490 [Actinoallomurus purpureus]|uniref:hypothetical protein n=1 Tax=Actinoallomurus purpureus TaxID=478114 RepID=UPI002092403F|nr:hypothetical protein [Actinoallomurus purpureus]MCO6008144.1 hypothetical protein [Actinoallomurus purpureus]